MARHIFTSLLFIFFLSFSGSVVAQEDWQKLLDEGSGESEKVIASFKTTRIINAQSIETVKRQTLDFRVGHRFGTLNAPGGVFHTWFGLDVSSDIRLGFEYGITDRLTVGFSRNKMHEHLQGLIKYRLLEQTLNNKMPFSVTVYGDANFTPERDTDSSYVKWEHRLSYITQVMIARKFSQGITLQLMPLWSHRNYIRDYLDENDLFALGIGGRIKFMKRAAFIFDYYQVLSKYRLDPATTYYPPLGLGVEIETGGHVFSIMFTNSAGINETDFIPHTTDNWLDGGVRFAFNISRVFHF